MNEFGRILEHVINAFDDISLAQHNLVSKRHQPVLHVGLYSCHYMDSVFEKSLEKPWRDVADGNHCTVHKTDAGTSAESVKLKEKTSV